MLWRQAGGIYTAELYSERAGGCQHQHSRDYTLQTEMPASGTGACVALGIGRAPRTRGSKSNTAPPPRPTNVPWPEE